MIEAYPPKAYHDYAAADVFIILSEKGCEVKQTGKESPFTSNDSENLRRAKIEEAIKLSYTHSSSHRRGDRVSRLYYMEYLRGTLRAPPPT